MISKEDFSFQMTQWHLSHSVVYPWRKTSDPYIILVCEILLRKTTRKQVGNIFAYFFRKYPNIHALASASVEQISKDIKCLGLEHKRAICLKAIAIAITRRKDSKVPTDRKELLELPGLGPYIANAVLVFAYGYTEPLVDTNIYRVVSRVLSIKSKKARARDDIEVWKAIRSLVPKQSPKIFYWGILDFAEQICKINPKCNSCFFNYGCHFFNETVK